MNGTRAALTLVGLITMLPAAGQSGVHHHSISPFDQEKLEFRRSGIIDKLQRLFRGRALIIADFRSFDEVNAFTANLKASGARVDQIHNRSVILAYVPAGLDEEIRRHERVRVFSRQAVDLTTEPFKSDEVAGGIARHFNRTLDGSLLREIEASADAEPVPMGEHVVLAPRFAEPSHDTASQSELVASTYANQFMSGLIGIQIHFVESDGTVDTNEFTWTSTDRGTIVTRSAEGYDWWDAEAFDRSISFSYSVIWKNANDYAALYQPYEPIRRDLYLKSHMWINPIMADFGYTINHADPQIKAIARVQQYNEDFQSAASADSAHSVFVIYNPGSAPTTHTDGYYTLSYFGGPWIDHPFRPGGYSTSDWGWVYAHEMGHTFWACDEYAASCSITGCNFCHDGFGPRDTSSNGNCQTCDATPFSCMMYSVNPNNIVCSYTETQIGW